jgi:hypothetical protein
MQWPVTGALGNRGSKGNRGNPPAQALFCPKPRQTPQIVSIEAMASGSETYRETKKCPLFLSASKNTKHSGLNPIFDFS